MKSLVYLSVCRYKNKLFELVRSPFKFILTLGFAILTVLNLFVDSFGYSGDRPLAEFKAIILAFYVCTFIMQSVKGFSHGGTMFSLTDVNFLFLSPIKPSDVLFHGMLGQLGSSLWMGLVFIYQFALLKSFYPVSVKEMLICVIGYGAVTFLSQLTGMLIYFFTCGEEKKIKKAKALYFALCAAFALLVSVRFITSDNFSISGLAMAVTFLPMRFFPVAGWVFTAVDGFILGDAFKISAGVALCLIFVIFCFALLSLSKHGYYEDVLLTAEKTTVSKESGKAASDIKISSDGRKGIDKGEGASVIFFKHMLENRRSKSLLFSPTSLFYLVIIAVYALVFKNGIISVFVMSCTASILTILSGRWIKELTMPYIYILPDKAVRKLFFMLPEMLPKIIAESVAQCAVIGMLCKSGVKMTVALIAARVAFSFLLMGSALVTARIFREREKNNIFAAVCILSGVIFSLPSAGCAAFVAFYGFGLVNAFFVMAAVNVAVGFMLLFFARKLLSFSD